MEAVSKGINHEINYIRLTNWYFENIPSLPGFKATYGYLFLTIINSINRNRWNKTDLPFEFIINKCKISKQLYLDARQWLINNDLLEIEFGKNGYQMASFDLGLAVRNVTATNTATNTADQSSTLPLLLPINKHTNNKTIKHLNISFDVFWNLYDKKVGSKSKLEKIWRSLQDEERKVIMQYLPEYIKSTPDKKFRKNPETFFSKKSWNDEVVGIKTTAIISKSKKPKESEYWNVEQYQTAFEDYNKKINC